MKHQLIVTTCPDEKSAGAITQALLERRLAACVSRLPAVQSSYEWKGEVCHEQELMLLIKSHGDHYPELEKTITELHPYELPEVIAIPIENGLAPYLAWVDQQTEQK